MQRWRTQIAGAVLIAVMAIALGVEASKLPHSVGATSTSALAATPFPLGHHTCTDAPGDNAGLTPSADGSFSGCLRVGPVTPGAYVVTVRWLTKSSQRLGSTRCAGRTLCAEMRAAPSEGPPGTLVAIDGWVPMTVLGNNAFVSVAIEPAINATAVWKGKPGYENDVLASTPFTVMAPPAWSSLPALHPSVIQRTGLDPIAADPVNPRRFAYCANGSIELTINGGRTWSSISLAGIRAASATTNYPVPGSFSPPSIICSAVALDARYPATFYATVLAVPRDSSPPPFYFTAYVTRNAGRSWQAVPIPGDSEMGMFGGFRVDASSAQALFWSTDSRNSPGPHPYAFHVEMSTDGGRTWQEASLHCPGAGPCVALGPQSNSRCQAVGEVQGVETSGDGGRTWTETRTLEACATSQLITAGPSTVLVIDQAFNHAELWLSTDTGATWRYIGLPAVPGSQADPGAINGTLEMLPDGRLLVAGDQWHLLPAGGSSWCAVTGVAGTPNAGWPPSPLPIGDRVWWSEVAPGAAVGVTLRSVPLSAIHC